MYVYSLQNSCEIPCSSSRSPKSKHSLLKSYEQWAEVDPISTKFCFCRDSNSGLTEHEGKCINGIKKDCTNALRTYFIVAWWCPLLALCYAEVNWKLERTMLNG